MSEHDELTEQVASICTDAYLTASISFVPEEVANRIIALVRADERRAIREALLSDEAIKAVFADDPVLGSYMPTEGDIVATRRSMRAALAAIGLTEETTT